MKQCPACNRTYANDKQKFCTIDGASLIDVQSAGTGPETVRIDSQQLDKEITKVISRELPNTGGVFDPYKTVVSTPQQTPPPAPPAAPPPVTPSAAAPIATPPAAAEAPPPSAAPPLPDLMKTSASLPATTSAPAPPPDLMKTSASLPATTSPPAPPQVRAEAPTVTSSAADEAGQVTLPPPSAQTVGAVAPAAQPRKKRSKLPLILGILFVLFLLGAGIAVLGYFFAWPKIKPLLVEKHIIAPEPRRAEPTPRVASTPRIEDLNPGPPRKLEVPPYSPPDDAVQFVNSNTKLTGKLAEHFVDFSFYYPKDWHKDPEAGTASSTNFAKVQRQLAADAPEEIFAVGWYGSTGAKDTDQASYARLVAERSAQFAKTYPEYQKVSQGSTKAGPYDAYEFRFSGIYRNTDRGDVKIWGRVMFVPPLEGTKGVTLLMLASSLAPEVKSVDDVGAKGQLPMILESFRFGK